MISFKKSYSFIIPNEAKRVDREVKAKQRFSQSTKGAPFRQRFLTSYAGFSYGTLPSVKR